MKKPLPFVYELAEDPTILRGVLEANVGTLPAVDVKAPALPLGYGEISVGLSSGPRLGLREWYGATPENAEHWLEVARAALALHLHVAAEARARRPA